MVNTLMHRNTNIIYIELNGYMHLAMMSWKNTGLHGHVRVIEKST